MPLRVLRLGPGHPDARRWLWANWGTTWPLRHVAELRAQKAGQRSVREPGRLRLGFWSADWTPWPALLRLREDWPALRFELCTGVSGVHYPHDKGRELHAVYHLRSITHNRLIRLEVSVPDRDPHIPSLFAVYPTCDWHERETYDFFGIVFDGHPALTRIMMPDDWQGHPQRKDYPLGGIPVEYKGAQIPAPDQRRSYS